nr:MAG TPA: hypothetical protein [Caudoviricetes sp.]
MLARTRSKVDRNGSVVMLNMLTHMGQNVNSTSQTCPIWVI